MRAARSVPRGLMVAEAGQEPAVFVGRDETMKKPVLGPVSIAPPSNSSILCLERRRSIRRASCVPSRGQRVGTCFKEEFKGGRRSRGDHYLVIAWRYQGARKRRESGGYDRGTGRVSNINNERHRCGTYLSKAELRVLPQGGSMRRASLPSMSLCGRAGLT